MTSAPSLNGAYDIVEIDGAATPEHVSPSIEFADGSTFGKVINNFRGTVAIDGDTLTAGPMMSTLMAGPPEAMAAENRVFALLGAPLAISADGDDVLLTGADGSLRLRHQVSDADFDDAAGATGGMEAESSSDGGTLTIHGSVWYRQRIALPPDARTTVTLQDIARQDVAATLLATYETTGGQVPIPFRLEVAVTDIPEHARLSVRGTIHDGDRLIWTSDTVYAVDPAAGDVTGLVIPLVQVGGDPQA
jgi:uncharacterized lipoprotein YbaY/heat shock protein HslJ